MFWRFLLAHLLADYALQPNWMARAKSRPPVLALHAAIHLTVLWLLVATVQRDLWPWLVLLAVVHFTIDMGKISLGKRRPNWIFVPYLIDQAIHGLVITGIVLISIGWTAFQMKPGTEIWVIYALGFLWVTYVWAITEKVLVTGDDRYRAEALPQFWPRMAVRAGLTVLWLSFLTAATSTAWLTPLSVLSFAWLPYFHGKYRRRILLTDLIISLAGALFIFVFLK